MAWYDVLDPNQNGFNNAMDPNRNGVADAFNPNKNGFNQAVGGFINNTVSPFANEFFTMFKESMMLPRELANAMFKQAVNLVQGNGIYWVIGIGMVCIVGGGIVYYKATH